MNILLTGCAGFIGYHTASKLLNKGYTVFGLDNLNDYYDVNLKHQRLSFLKRYPEFRFYNSDINNLKHLEFPKIQVTIHLAAQAGVRLPISESYKYVESNISGFLSVLNFCNEKKVNKIIYASSSSVYSGCDQKNYSEDSLLQKPKSLYASTKIFNEHIAEIYCKEKNIEAVGLRFFTVYGSWGRPDMAYYLFTENINNNLPLKVFGDGSLKRDMTHIDDITNGIISSLKFAIDNKYKHEIFNLGNEKPVSSIELINIIEKNLNKLAVIQFEDKHDEVTETKSSNTKAKKILNYSPKITLEEGYKEFLDWYLKMAN